MKTSYLAVIALCFVGETQAQQYGLPQLEAQFLQQNSELLASKFNIERADAEIVQEKLWSNPTLSISEVNLWKTYKVEEQPFLFGKYGNNQQISVELEQLIETAGKRKKRIAVKELEKKNSIFEFEELLRELKKELRQTYYSLGRLNQQEVQLKNMVDLFVQLQSQYEKQAQLQNIPKADFFRVQSELIGLQKEQIELQSEQTEMLSKLRLLTHNNMLSLEQLDFSSFKTISNQFPIDLKEKAKEQNIGIRRQENEIFLAEKQWKLEKAQRIPDMTFQVNYDRGGNIMRDFVGVGVSFDLPVFNSNKGNIKSSQLNIQQQKEVQTSLLMNLETTIDRLQNQLQILDKILSNDVSNHLEEQQKMIENYRKHLNSKQITLLEFIDFTQAFREAQNAYLEMKENHHNTREELQYIVGQDF